MSNEMKISKGVTPFSLIVAIHLNKLDEDVLDEGIVVVYHAHKALSLFLLNKKSSVRTTCKYTHFCPVFEV